MSASPHRPLIREYKVVQMWQGSLAGSKRCSWPRTENLLSVTHM